MLDWLRPKWSAESRFVQASEAMLTAIHESYPQWERIEFVRLPNGQSRLFVTPPYHPDVDPDGPKAIPRTHAGDPPVFGDDHIPAGTRLTFSRYEPPRGWRLVERMGEAFIFCEKK